MVGVEVGDEHRIQAAEVEARVDERGRRSATAVDDEHALADDEHRRDPASAGDRHRGARRPQQNELGAHACPARALIEVQDDPRRPETHGCAQRCVDQSQDRLLPDAVGTKRRHPEHDRRGDAGGHGVLRPSEQRRGQPADPDHRRQTDGVNGQDDQVHQA